MKKLVILSLLLLIGGMGLSELAAQRTHPILEASRIPPRPEDHFWRRKVVNRIDLDEKINEPLRQAEDLNIYGNPHGHPEYGEKNGIIAALFNGLKSGKYLAYRYDSLDKSLTYDDIKTMALEIENAGAVEEDDWGAGESDDFGMDEFDTGDGFGEDEFDDLGDTEGDNDPFGGGGDTENKMDISPFETVLEFIEDRIFDKNRSDMIYDIQYLRIVWTDPAETLPDKNFCVFRYSDVLETLEDTQWKNKYNDAEYRNLREIFELRLFNSVIFNVSGRGVKTLEEADFRRNQLVEFEHHLWSY